MPVRLFFFFFCPSNAIHSVRRRRKSGYPVSIHFPLGIRLLQEVYSFNRILNSEKGTPPIPIPSSSPPVYISYVLVSLLNSRKPFIDGAYRGRDIGDSEIDVSSKLQGIEVVSHKDRR